MNNNACFNILFVIQGIKKHHLSKEDNVRLKKTFIIHYKENAMIILAILLILDTIVILLIGGGVNIGTILPGVFGIFIILWKYYRQLIPIKLKVFMKWGGIIIASSFILIQIGIWTNALSKDTYEPEYIIILGAGLNGDKVSLTLSERLDKGIELATKHTNSKVIVSGGQGFGETITEAEAMKRYMINKGIVAERIIEEDRATSTLENIIYSKELMHDEKAVVALITSEFHMFRARLIAKFNGLRTFGVPSPTPFYLLPNSCLREYFAIIKSLIKDI